MRKGGEGEAEEGQGGVVDWKGELGEEGGWNGYGWGGLFNVDLCVYHWKSVSFMRSHN